MNKKGSVIILAVFLVIIFTILGISLISSSITENVITQKHRDLAIAFWAAESGANDVLNQLRGDFNLGAASINTSPLGVGSNQAGYEVVSVQDVSNQIRIFTIRGFVPFSGTRRAERSIEVVLSKYVPPNFYDNAIYSAGDIDINGNSYSVNGDVIYSGDFDVDNPENINGSTTQDSSITPLARFDFGQALALSQNQNTDSYPNTGNTYSVNQSGKLIDPETGADKPLPGSFWYTTADDGVDNDLDGTTDESDEWVPNICHINGDLKLNGDIGTVGGFLLVVGDVINTPDVTQEAIINGNGLIDGVIYARGEFRVNGGGSGLNVNGGIWGGEQVRLNGNADITYNTEYMHAIQDLGIDGSVQITSWRDIENVYPVN